MQQRYGFTPHQTPETICKTCGGKMRPEQAKNGGWLVNCAACRHLNRRAEHRRFRRHAEAMKRLHDEQNLFDFASRYPYMASFIGHDCDKAGCK